MLYDHFLSQTMRNLFSQHSFVYSHDSAKIAVFQQLKATIIFVASVDTGWQPSFCMCAKNKYLRLVSRLKINSNKMALPLNAIECHFSNRIQVFHRLQTNEKCKKKTIVTVFATKWNVFNAFGIILVWFLDDVECEDENWFECYPFHAQPGSNFQNATPLTNNITVFVLYNICAIFCNWHFMAFKYQTNINFNSVDIHILDSVTIRNIRIFMISYDKLFHFVEFSIAIPTYLFYWPFLLSRVANHSLLLLCVATKKRTTAIPSNRMKSRVDEVEISTSSSGW